MRKLHDSFFKKAKAEGHLARSIYKLEELDKRMKLFQPGMRVLDIGASPGSWLQYILKTVGENGVVCAIDLKVIAPQFKGKVHFKQMDARDFADDLFSEVAPKFNAVVSDMAPNTSGIRDVDQARSLELCELAWQIAEKRLSNGGFFIVKVFDGPDFQKYRNRVASHFALSRVMKPQASRRESIELYLVCSGYKLPQKPKRVRRDHIIRKTKGKRTRQY